MRPRRITYANVTATLALIVALSGGAYAATKIGSNDIARNSVKGKHVVERSLEATCPKGLRKAGKDVCYSTTGAELSYFDSLERCGERGQRLPTVAEGYLIARALTGPAENFWTSEVVSESNGLMFNGDEAFSFDLDAMEAVRCVTEARG